MLRKQEIICHPIFFYTSSTDRWRTFASGLEGHFWRQIWPKLFRLAACVTPPMVCSQISLFHLQLQCLECDLSYSCKEGAVPGGSCSLATIIRNKALWCTTSLQWRLLAIPTLVRPWRAKNIFIAFSLLIKNKLQFILNRSIPLFWNCNALLSFYWAQHTMRHSGKARKNEKMKKCGIFLHISCSRSSGVKSSHSISSNNGSYCSLGCSTQF